ncbi:MAG: glycosyl transferase [Flammeovirgaceae bacterium]|nr:glycosyl transferase [Flammeovirgaceae bacterium]
MEKRVLIITYYWPPSGGSGVQRWLKFVKYLPKFGWQPYVFTPENPSFDVKDESLLRDIPPEAEVIKLPIWEPYDTFSKLSGLFQGKKVNSSNFITTSKKSLFQKMAMFIRGNFFIPDPKVFWVRPSVNFLHDFLKERQIETIITTGPPHSMHLIGLRLKKKNPSLKWIADFRDPWSEWGFLDSLDICSPVRAIHKKLEARVLRGADQLVTITPFYVKKFEKLSGKSVSLLTNGFDVEDFKTFQYKAPEKFTIRHVGIINEKCDPRPLMTIIEKMCITDNTFRNNLRLEFVGQVHKDFQNFIKTSQHLSEVTQITPTVEHEKLIFLYSQSSILLLVLTGYKDAEGYLPGKLFEYMATGLPILGVGPVDGDASKILNSQSNGLMANEKDENSIKDFLLVHFEKWRKSESPLMVNHKPEFSRKEITEKLALLLK